MNYEENPKSIKYHVKRFLQQEQARFKGKKVVDFPAGNGVTTRILQEIGAEPIPLDLFPEYFELSNITCRKADINEGIPLKHGSVDFAICQEGIEHFSDQLLAFKAFNKVLKSGGTLVVTTPNYSSLRSKMSYLLSESERFNSIMAPNELDSIWMSQQKHRNDIYFGHIFLVGALKLRCLAKLAGFKVKKVRFVRIGSTSLLLLLIFYPFIWLSNYFNYLKNMRKNQDYDRATKKEIYGEIFKLATDIRLLIDAHLFMEFEKELEPEEAAASFKSRQKEFGIT